MTVTKTASASTAGGTSWIRLSGTIQEVLDALSSEMMSALNCAYWYDDGTDAKALVCRQH
jgi:hypothetical protein